MKITLIKTLNGSFKPAYDTDYENAKKIKPNEPYEFEFKKPRNYKFHCKFFALINMVFQNQEVYSNIDDMREDLIADAGFYYTVIDMHGNERKKAKSISFAAMDEIEFNDLYSRVIDSIVNWLKWERQDIIDNIDQFF